jgi:hypothetical protein
MTLRLTRRRPPQRQLAPLTVDSAAVADDAIKAEIVFDNNETMEVQSTVQEVRTEIEGQKRMALPLIKVLDHDGAEVWLNATHIRMIKAAAGLD